MSSNPETPTSIPSSATERYSESRFFVNLESLVSAAVPLPPPRLSWKFLMVAPTVSNSPPVSGTPEATILLLNSFAHLIY